MSGNTGRGSRDGAACVVHGKAELDSIILIRNPEWISIPGTNI
jgi:hypothetical protein